MKTRCFLLLIAAFGLLPAAAHAGTRASARYTIATDSTDAAGVGRAQSTSYVVSGNAVGEFGTGAPTTVSASYTDKPGYVGTLYNVVGLAVTSASASNAVPEGGQLQLGAAPLLDDGTLLGALASSGVSWAVLSGPLASISAGGLATAATVYANTLATVRATSGGLTGTGALTVLNVNTDDYGPYAGDGIDDAWQIMYFGTNNPKAGPNVDADGTGQTNLFKYLAGLNPLDPTSRFVLAAGAATAQPGTKTLTFSPIYSGRTYTVQYTGSLSQPNWQTLPNATTSDNGTTRTVTDPGANTAQRFYRVQISMP